LLKWYATHHLTPLNGSRQFEVLQNWPLFGAKPNGAKTLSGHGGVFDWATAKPPPEPRTAAKTKADLNEFLLAPSASFMPLTPYFGRYSPDDSHIAAETAVIESF
jgi:hypothetical protein